MDSDFVANSKLEGRACFLRVPLKAIVSHSVFHDDNSGIGQ